MVQHVVRAVQPLDRLPSAEPAPVAVVRLTQCPVDRLRVDVHAKDPARYRMAGRREDG